MSTEAGVESKVREAVRLLTELQDIDDELRDIELERGDLPDEVERLEKRIRDAEAFVTSTAEELEKMVHSIAERQQQVSEARDRLAKFQEQLYAVKTTREYDAITVEFNFAKEQISSGEAAIAEHTHRKEELARLIEQRKAELEKVRADEQTKGAELRQRLSETEDEERQLRHRRENVVVRLMKPLYAHYERIRNAKEGRGVARIMDGACGGCFAVIPHQTQVNIRKQTDIVLCETCGRILVP